MGFLAPLMLIGVLGLAVPIAIHLIGRQRAYFADMLGGPRSDVAPDLAAAHEGVAIDDHHVALVVGHLREALLGADVDPVVAERVVAVAARIWYASNW